MAERLGDALLQRLGDVVFEDLGLGMHSSHGMPSLVQEGLQRGDGAAPRAAWARIRRHALGVCWTSPDSSSRRSMLLADAGVTPRASATFDVVMRPPVPSSCERR
jgi:hypothetical protein